MTGSNNLPQLLCIYLMQQQDMKNTIFTMAYENEIKPTPLEKPIVAICASGTKIGERKTKTANDGSITLTNERDQTLDIKLGFYLPYSAGAVGCYDLFDTVIQKVFTSYNILIESVACGEVNYVRDTGGLVLECTVTLKRTVTTG